MTTTEISNRRGIGERNAGMFLDGQGPSPAKKPSSQYSCRRSSRPATSLASFKCVTSFPMCYSLVIRNLCNSTFASTGQAYCSISRSFSSFHHALVNRSGKRPAEPPVNQAVGTNRRLEPRLVFASRFVCGISEHETVQWRGRSSYSLARTRHSFLELRQRTRGVRLR